MHACMDVCMYVCMHACMHVCMYVCMYVCIYVCVCFVRVRVRVCVCVRVCVGLCAFAFVRGVAPPAPDATLPAAQISRSNYSIIPITIPSHIAYTHSTHKQARTHSQARTHTCHTYMHSHIHMPYTHAIHTCNTHTPQAQPPHTYTSARTHARAHMPYAHALTYTCVLPFLLRQRFHRPCSLAQVQRCVSGCKGSCGRTCCGCRSSCGRSCGSCCGPSLGACEALRVSMPLAIAKDLEALEVLVPRSRGLAILRHLAPAATTP